MVSFDRVLTGESADGLVSMRAPWPRRLFCRWGGRGRRVGVGVVFFS